MSHLSTIAAQLRRLLLSLNRENYTDNLVEIKDLCDVYGTPASIILLSTLLNQIDFNEPYKYELLLPLLQSIIIRLAKHVNFEDMICRSLETSHNAITMNSLCTMCEVLDLPFWCHIAIALGICHSETNKKEAIRFLKHLMLKIGNVNEHGKIPEELLHRLTSYIQRENSFSERQQTQYNNLIEDLYPQAFHSFLKPLVCDSKQDTEPRAEISAMPSDGSLVQHVSMVNKLSSPANLLKDLGCSSMSSVSQLRNILAQFPKLKKQDIADIVAMIVRTHANVDVDADSTMPLASVFNMSITFHNNNNDNSLATPTTQEDRKSSLSTWQISVFLRTMKEMYPRLAWSEVYDHLDTEDFFVPDYKAFLILCEIYEQATDGALFPMDILFRPWKNVLGQFSMIRQAVKVPVNTLNFLNSPRVLKLPKRMFMLHEHRNRSDSSMTQHRQRFHCWYSLDLLDVLLKFMETDLKDNAFHIFDFALKKCPELLLLGLSHMQETYSKQGGMGSHSTSANSIQTDILIEKLFIMSLEVTKSETKTNSIFSTQISSIMTHIFETKSAFLTQWMVRIFSKDQNYIKKIVEMACIINGLDVFLGERLPFAFTLSIAALASKRGLIDLQTWIQRRDGIESSLDYIREYRNEASDIVLLCISNMNLTNDMNMKLKQIMHQRSAPVHDLNIEKESIEKFDKLYSKEISLDIFIDTLLLLKTSNNQNDRILFDYMIYDLFEQYNMIEKYNIEKITLMGQLYGLLVRKSIVENITLGITLRYILEALKKSNNSLMFMFGYKALETFQDIVGLYPQYCILLCQIATIQTNYITLYNYLTNLMKNNTNMDINDMSNGYNSDQGVGVLASNTTATVTVTTSVSQEWTSDPTQSNENMFGRLANNKQSYMNSTSTTIVGTEQRKINNNLTHGNVPSFEFKSIKSGHRHMSSMPTTRQTPIDQQDSSSTSPSLTPRIGLGFGGNNTQTTTSTTTSGSKRVSSSSSKSTTSKNVGLTPGKKKLSSHGSSSGFGNAVSIDTLLQAQNRGKAIVAPSDAVRDRMHFIVNNVDGVNYKLKAQEMIALLKEKYYAYICQYLVIRRVSVEVNFQKTYCSWLDEMNLPGLKKKMLETTYTNVNILVNSSKILKVSSERTLLKNLGSWLGLLTLAIDKPILSKYLNLRELILSAYENERLIAVIPFAATVLGHCKTSKVFHLPNPWFSRIMSVLRELYELPELKLNLKFAIEVMFQSLDIHPNDIPITHMLRERSSRRGGDQGEHRSDSVGSPELEGSVGNFNPEDSPQLGPLSSELLSSKYISIHPSIEIFISLPQLKRLVPRALENAIKDILQPVVERSVTIACVTARELVVKDFAFEADETKMRKAAHSMVKTMTASLALVTCKEHLRAAISKHLSKLFEANSNASPQQIEQAYLQLMTDNLNVCCNVIENAASDRAVREIDDSLAPLYALRRKHRQENPSTPYAVVAMINSPNSRIASALPDLLRPNPGGLTNLQLQVYEDFDRLHPSKLSSPTRNGPDGKTSMDMMMSSSKVNGPKSSSDAPIDAASWDASLPPPMQNALSGQQTLDKLVSRMHTLSQTINNFRNSRTTGLQALLAASGNRNEDHEIIAFLRMIPSILNSAPRDENFPPEAVAFNFANSVYKSLFDPAHVSSLLHIDVHLAVLKSIASVTPTLVNELTLWLFGGDDDNKYKLDIVAGMIKLKLLFMQDVDNRFSNQLISLMRSNQVFVIPQNSVARQTRRIHPKLEFIINFVRRVICKDNSCYAHELGGLCDHISAMAQQFQNHPSELHSILTHLLQEVRIAAMNAEREREERKRILRNNVPGDGDPDERDVEIVKQMSRVEESPNAMQQSSASKSIVYLFDEWLNICLQGNASDKTYAKYLSLLQQQRVLITPESSIRFFRIIIQLCVDASFGVVGRLSYTGIDALAKLVVFLVKFLDPSGGSNPQSKTVATKIRILSLFLNSVAWSLLKEYEAKKDVFDQRPYLRLFTNLLNDLNTPDPSLDSNNTDVLISFARVFYLIRPTRVPAFAFAWLELISHRTFMPKMLISKKPQCMHLFHGLLINLLILLQPYLRHANLIKSIRLLYKGTLRVLLVLLHDFPEFICEFYFSLCDVIPTTCVQMRNLILSAFPRNMRLPDPFTPNLKVDLLPEIVLAPRIMSDIMYVLEKHKHELLVPLDGYLKKRQPKSILKGIHQLLIYHTSSNMSPQDVSRAIQKYGTKYDVPLINSLVLYIGIQAISNSKRDQGKMFTLNDTPYMDVFIAIVKQLDNEGIYYVINAIANQLRYPNSHTHYFSCVLLYLFVEEQSMVKELITRVLLERLIVHRPHPWGLLITFIELIKNPSYDFLNQPFTRIAPEVEKLFESVARSCIPPQDANNTNSNNPNNNKTNIPSNK